MCQLVPTANNSPIKHEFSKIEIALDVKHVQTKLIQAQRLYKEKQTEIEKNIIEQNLKDYILLRKSKHKV